MSGSDHDSRVASVRRVVTGVDDRGRSVIVSDGEAPNVFRSPSVPGLRASQVWATASGPVSNDEWVEAAGADADIPMYPPLGGTIFRVVDFPPDTAYAQADQERLFSDIGGTDAQEGAEHSGGRHFWFHKTDTIDFAVVLEGEIWMLLDDGEALLTAGDVVVQRGTAHSWSNRSGRPCRMAFVLLGALPAGEAPATRTGELPVEAQT